ncbi:NUDIX domain-containing protein [Ponticoccus sp. SC2-23]|uniref:NUDIX hydrolase n=1 Tax=Alexandriicola marinus TaxID=2081710 RepID=UPI000FD6D453|nr:NUDIX domain-containing protein [Alexandriicola marinus]MBM1221191.1 NUDIX domain-containing protein [Ponticoccus sp. SC6-9]MBM1225761.1 NUDIX domain-containing protein [Ponticoccus sp. SC6-15]MBM1227913.1 NUDIX domain-containing protein [Ponticoccus sp. SC6-38]MBM1234449.1 NUDIX domain-containing protein [Ponticoccus sp. SC6-45]MBM1238415.1 NUDIX domain-containing protein [Ponticoccus sp. SC6-49]MBM1243684.1 NUDIX domain-containing protein [Ponticoccus sp. SC2-64]MBM1247973.1 NUDIX domai
MTDKSQLRDAATIVLMRDEDTRPRILMGQRGAGAAFLPNKFVFPGGAVDAVDGTIPLARPLRPDTHAALGRESGCTPEALAAAALRELWEETGLILGDPHGWAEPPPRGWRGFAAAGFAPSGAELTYIFRAVTPLGRPRRFDARFFLARAEALATDPDDFSRAEDELNHLQWIPLDTARDFDLPFITEVVLAELSGRIAGTTPPDDVPFFRNDDEAHLVTRLGGRRPLD